MIISCFTEENCEFVNKKNTCQLCSNLVNPLEQLCKECKKNGSVSAILASREIEDWGGLVNKNEKKNGNT